MYGPEVNYYEVLGVSQKATPDEIQAAFKKEIMRWHPDRNRDNVEEAHQRAILVNQARDVLADPVQRAWYDALGSRGLSSYESLAKSIDAETLYEVIQMLSGRGAFLKLRFILLGVLFLSIVPLLTLFVIFLCLRLDDDIRWPWSVVFSPILFLELTFVVAMCCCCPCTWLISKSLWLRCKYIQCWFTITFTVLIVIKLEGAMPSVPWTVVFVPYFLRELCSLVPDTATILRILLKKDTANEQEISRKEYFFKLFGAVYSAYTWWSLRIIFAILLLLRIDKHWMINWWLVFTPLYLGGVFMVGKSMAACLRRASDKEDPDSWAETIIRELIHLVVPLTYFPTLIMICVRLENITSFHSFIVILPFLLLPCLLCGCTCVLRLSLVISDISRSWPPKEDMPSPHGDDDPLLGDDVLIFGGYGSQEKVTKSEV